MSTERLYSTKRNYIVSAMAEKLKEIDGTGEYLTNLYQNVSPRLLFWDEVTEFPAVHLNAGSETRRYQAGGYKDRFLSVTIRCYVQEDDAANALGRLLEDVETLLEETTSLRYYDIKGKAHNIKQITILGIDTDEGVLEPLGVAEMQLEVHY